MQKFILSIFLIAANCLTFWGVQDFGFVWTDKQQIIENTAINPPSREGIRNIWKGVPEGIYAPVAQSAQAGIARLSRSRVFQNTQSDFINAAAKSEGLAPRAFHITNLTIHTINSILVFLILSMIFKGNFASFFGALLFATHPLQVEPIAWASGLSYVLGSMFALLALWQYLVFSKMQDAHHSSRRPLHPYHHFYAATFCYLLALLTIPSMIVVPLIAFILEKILPKERGFLPARKPVWPFLLWMVLGIPAMVLAINSQATLAISTENSIWIRPLLAADAIVFYIQKLFLPIGIGPDYGRSPAMVLSTWWGYTAWIIPAVFSLYLLYTRSKSRLWVGGAFLVLVAGLLPFLGLFAFESQSTSTVANRYIYLAMLGPAIWMGYLISIPKTLTMPFIGVVTTLTFAFLSLSEIGNWKNDESLWKHALEINEGSPIAHKVLADQYRERKDWTNARDHYRKVLISNTTSPEVQFHLADIERLLGNQKEAIPLYEKVLKLDPGFAAAHNALGLSLFAEKKYSDALVHFKKSVESEKDNALYLHNLGRTFVSLEEYSQSIPPLRRALKTKALADVAVEAETQALLGQALEKTDQKEMGQIHLETALKLSPDHAIANRILADVYFSQKNFEDALPHYLKAVSTYPENESILFNLGVISSEKLSFTKAKGYFERALEISPNSNATLTKLAIAEFHLKKFKGATEHFQKALEINPKTADAYYYLGDIARWKGKKEESLALYYRALKISKDHSKAHYRLGNYFMGKERIRQAIRHYKSALKDAPNNRHVIANLKRAEQALKSESM